MIKEGPSIGSSWHCVNLIPHFPSSKSTVSSGWALICCYKALGELTKPRIKRYCLWFLGSFDVELCQRVAECCYVGLFLPQQLFTPRFSFVTAFVSCWGVYLSGTIRRSLAARSWIFRLQLHLDYFAFLRARNRPDKLSTVSGLRRKQLVDFNRCINAFSITSARIKPC